MRPRKCFCAEGGSPAVWRQAFWPEDLGPGISLAVRRNSRIEWPRAFGESEESMVAICSMIGGSSKRLAREKRAKQPLATFRCPIRNSNGEDINWWQRHPPAMIQPSPLVKAALPFRTGTGFRSCQFPVCGALASIFTPARRSSPSLGISPRASSHGVYR